METIEIIGIAIGTAATVLGGMWFMLNNAFNKGRIEAENTAAVKKISDKHNELQCVKNSEYINRIKRSADRSDSNHEMLRIISAWVMKQDAGTIGDLSQKFSPRRMTSIGERLFIESKAKEVIEQNIDFFVYALHKIGPRTAYDVENKALEVILPNLALDMFIPIKTYLYNAPDYLEYTDPDTNEQKQAKINMQGVVFLMSLYLRDVYLERYESEIEG